MKILVQECYGDKRKFIVSENMIKEGYYLGEQNDLLTCATIGDLMDFENQIEIKNFKDFIKKRGLKYCVLPSLIECNKIRTLVAEYPFYFQNFCCDIGKSSEIFNNERCEYVVMDKPVPIFSLEILQLRETGLIEYINNKLCIYDIYTNIENTNLYLYCRGSAGDVEEVSEKELYERFKS